MVTHLFDAIIFCRICTQDTSTIDLFVNPNRVMGSNKYLRIPNRNRVMEKGAQFSENGIQNHIWFLFH